MEAVDNTIEMVFVIDWGIAMFGIGYNQRDK